MSSRKMSTSSVKENETVVSQPTQSAMKPGAYLANPVRALNIVVV
jgi:hypothetical protein